MEVRHRFEGPKTFYHRGHERTRGKAVVFFVSLYIYSTFSATQREMAVTIFRGANLVDWATSQLCVPLIARVRPSITAR